MLTYTCPHCGKRLSIPEQCAGQAGTCTKCGNHIVLPSFSEMASAEIASMMQGANVRLEKIRANVASVHRPSRSRFRFLRVGTGEDLEVWGVRIFAMGLAVVGCLFTISGSVYKLAAGPWLIGAGLGYLAVFPPNTGILESAIHNRWLLETRALMAWFGNVIPMGFGLFFWLRAPEEFPDLQVADIPLSGIIDGALLFCGILVGCAMYVALLRPLTEAFLMLGFLGHAIVICTGGIVLLLIVMFNERVADRIQDIQSPGGWTFV